MKRNTAESSKGSGSSSSSSKVSSPTASAPAQRPRQQKLKGPAILHILMDVFKQGGWLVVLYALYQTMKWAYEIRLYAVKEYGFVIHEFDPWFNFRATEYLAEKGWDAFFSWYDHKVWYPIGRPISTTIYPGMQIASVVVWKAMALYGEAMSLNDVCCLIPAWFAGAASLFIGLLAMECSGGSGAAAVVGAATMAILPAHASRSVAGGFDNEAVAIPFMCAAFYLWCRSLRNGKAWHFAALAGLAYACMAASWGGYVFALNVIGVHAGSLLVLAYDPVVLHRAYSIFYIVGTAGAVMVPVVGWSPFRSMEQLGPLGVFVILQIVWLAQRQNRIANHMSTLAIVGAVGVLCTAVLIPSGFFGPLSVRVRALFLEHTRTGNPLVDSVAEHQPSSPAAYWTYLYKGCYTATVGFSVLTVQPAPMTAARIFLLELAGITYFFSLKMRRLITLMAPPAAALTGVLLGMVYDWAVSPLHRMVDGPGPIESSDTPMGQALKFYNQPGAMLSRILFTMAALVAFMGEFQDFYEHCDNTIRWSLSHPQIMTKNQAGQIIDDYREAYWWLRDNTKEDARIMAWWDYGYQITGIGRRTTIADGNTWNHEHIALLGLCLSSPVEDAHQIAKHLADYVLIWTGGSRDDIGKSSHMARIANSVYKGHCAEEDCDEFGIHETGAPSKMMGSSLIWYLDNRGKPKGSPFPDSDRFKEVFVSENSKVRIVEVLQVDETSKAWAANPKNWVCDSPTSWICKGQYPPKLMDLFNESVASRNPEAAAFQKSFRRRVEEQRAALPLPNGPGIPEGSYLHSCRGCRISGDDGKTLECTHCRKPGRPAGSSALDLKTCEILAVNNIHGSLQCQPLPNEPNIPPGAYQGSCLGCKMVQNQQVLDCSHCGTADGRQVRSTYEVSSCPPPGRFDNQDGVLTCLGLVSARNIPHGAYKETCSGCELVDSGARLLCRLCRKADGRQVKSSLSLSRCLPPGKIENQDGTLRCGGLSNAANLPAGGYRGSCTGCRLEEDGALLFCSHCLDSTGAQVPTSLRHKDCVPPANLENRGGRLECVSVPNSLDIPPGPYSSSCQGCTMQRDGKVLVCSRCTKPNGQQQESALVLDLCPQPPGVIENYLGVLSCQNVPNEPNLPSGGYLDSCTGCRLEQATRLVCNLCRSAEGHQRRSELDLSACAAPPDNQNGVLVCGS